MISIKFNRKEQNGRECNPKGYGVLSGIFFPGWLPVGLPLLPAAPFLPESTSLP
jgi:hypothetical protein